MRFVLDHDVPVSCRTGLTEAGHEAWTVGEAGRARATDDSQTVYAAEMGAVLITLDREFTERRKRNAIGQHVRLTCEEPDAADLLRRYLPDMVSVLERHQDITIDCRPMDFSCHFGWE